MKKYIIRFIMILAFCSTIYFIFYWEPKEEIDRSISELACENMLSSNMDEDECEMVSSEENMSIFKINREDIVKNINKKELIEIDNVINSMSVIDIGKIEDYDIMEEAEIIDLFKFLNKRLSKKNYNTIRNILAPYINFQLIEGYI